MGLNAHLSGRRLQTILFVAFCAFLLVASPPLFSQRAYGASTSTQTDNTGITPQWLSQQLQVWKPSANTSLNFEVLFARASYSSLELSYNNLTVEEADLNMLFSTGAKCIRIDINYAPWLQNDQAHINELNTLVQDIRSHGECLVIADSSSETYRSGGQIPWTQFQAAWIQRDKTLAQLYHPDYFIVIKEPGWYVPMVSDALTNPSFQSSNSWLNLTQILASTVLSVSPNTKVGVSVAADSLTTTPSLYVPYLNGVSQMANISFIGYDVYDVQGFTNTQNFLSQYGSGEKSVWIAEAWTGDGNFIFDSSRAQLDSQWMLVLYYFAEYIHASALMPFYTDLFASYSLTTSSPTDSAQIISLFNQRTPVYNEYSSIISASPTTTTTFTTQTTSSSTSNSTSVQTQSSTQSTSTTSSSTSTSSSQSATSSSHKVSVNLSFTLVLASVLVGALILSLAVMFSRRRWPSR